MHECRGQAPGKKLTRAREHAVHRFVEEYIQNLGVLIREGEHAGFHKHLKGVDVEGKRMRSLQHSWDEH